MRWALLVLFATLPLQWFVVPGVPLGQGRLHLVVMMLFLALIVASHRLRAFRPTLRICLPFVAAALFLLVIWVATAFYHTRPLLPPVQDVVYLSVMLAVGTVVYRLAAAGPDAVRLLRWSALAASLVLGLGMSISMAVNGVNPVQVFATTIATGDPEVLQRELFRSAFVGFGLDEEDVSGNARHEIFGAILASLYVSSWAAHLQPPSERSGLLLYRASLCIGAGLLLVSMSRAVLIAALLWPLLGLFRLLVSGRMRPGHLALVAVSAVGLLAATAAGFVQVIWFRFTADTSSYEARNGLYDLAVENIRNSPLTGGAETAGASAHNFIVDSWQRSGILAAVAATVMVGLLLGLFFALAARIGEEPDWMVPVTAALALPLIRIFTAGGGLITPVSWIVLGFVAGVVAYRTRTAMPAASEPVAAHDTSAHIVRARRDRTSHA